MTPPKPIVILHIDDSETNRYIINQILKQAGFVVIEAATGTEGLNLLEQQKPDLIILDIQLPDMNGFEICHQIKSNPKTASIPILHLSATFINTEARMKSLESGAEAYLIEPVNAVELIVNIKALLRIRRAEETAFNAAQEWRITFDAISDAVCLLDKEYKVQRCNLALSNLINKKFQEIKGKLYADLLEEYLGIKNLTNWICWENVKARQVIELKTVNKNNGDAGYWFRLQTDPVWDGEGNLIGVVCILIDITESKRTQEAWRQSEARFRRLYESNMIGVIFADIYGNVTQANDMFLSMIGYSKEDLYQQKINWRNLTPIEYQEISNLAIAKILESGYCNPYEKEYIRKDGTRINIIVGAALLEGSREKTVGFILDISQQKSVEIALKQLNNELEEKVKERTYQLNQLIEQLNKEIEERSQIEVVMQHLNEALGSTNYDLQESNRELHNLNIQLAITHKAVEAERKRYQELFEFAPDGYFVTNTAGIICEANRAAARMLNCQQNVLLGSPLINFVAEDDREILETLHRNLRQRPYNREWEIIIQPDNSSAFLGSFTVGTKCDAYGEPVGYLWLMKNINDRLSPEIQNQ